MSTLDQIVADVVSRKLEEIEGRKRHSEGKIKVTVNDFDQRTGNELARENFSGLRANNFLMRFEIWLVGRLHREMAYSKFYSDPNSLTRWYADAFGLDVELDEQTQGAVLEVEARKAASYYYDEVVLKGKKQ